ncbi:MAG: DUF2163 domain-containing protein [Sphingobium sp.]|nr:DUF2163 domain-containing protein [Sphingobium sp.]
MSDAAILGQSLCAFAFCWRLERRDGVTIGLTSHDRTVMVDGLRYEPAPGITPSAIQHGGDPRTDIAEVAGALSGAALSEADLDAGRWDGASAVLHLTEWTEPGTLWLELARGTLGSVARSSIGYSAALKGLGVQLAEEAAPATSPTCRARFGDRDCTVDLRPLQSTAVLIEAHAERVRFDGLGEGLYLFGSLRWLTGPCAGIAQMIVGQDGDDLFLAEPPPLAVEAGMRALLTQGCDKRLATCSARFGNAANFRGEPFLPGMDLLTRYPGQ